MTEISRVDREMSEALAVKIFKHYFDGQADPASNLKPLIISDNIPLDLDCRSDALLVMGVNPGQNRPSRGMLPTWFLEPKGEILRDRLDNMLVWLAYDLDEKFQERRKKVRTQGTHKRAERVLITVVTRDSNVQAQLERFGIPTSSSSFLSDALPPSKRPILRKPLIAWRLHPPAVLELDQALIGDMTEELEDSGFLVGRIGDSEVRNLPVCRTYPILKAWKKDDLWDYIGVMLDGGMISMSRNHWYFNSMPKAPKTGGYVMEFGIRYPGLGKAGLDLDAGKVFLPDSTEAPVITKYPLTAPIYGFSFLDKLVLTGGRMPSGRAVSCFFFPEITKDDPVEYRHNGQRLWSFAGDMPELPENMEPEVVPAMIVSVLSSVARFYPRGIEITDEAFDNFLTLPKMSTFSGTAVECSVAYRMTTSTPISPNLVDRLLRSRASTGRPVGTNPSIKIIRIQDTPSIYRVQPIPSDLGRIANALESIAAKWDRYAPMPEEEERFTFEDAMKCFTGDQMRQDEQPKSKAAPEEPIKGFTGLTVDTDLFANGVIEDFDVSSEGEQDASDLGDSEEDDENTVELGAPDCLGRQDSISKLSSLIPVVPEEVRPFLPKKTVQIDETKNRVSFLAERVDNVPRVTYYLPGPIEDKVNKAYAALSPKKGESNQLWNELADHFTMRRRLKGEMMRELDDVPL